jgi:hypothetical protein
MRSGAGWLACLLLADDMNFPNWDGNFFHTKCYVGIINFLFAVVAA